MNTPNNLTLNGLAGSAATSINGSLPVATNGFRPETPKLSPTYNASLAALLSQTVSPPIPQSQVGAIPPVPSSFGPTSPTSPPRTPSQILSPQMSPIAVSSPQTNFSMQMTPSPLPMLPATPKKSPSQMTPPTMTPPSQKASTPQMTPPAMSPPLSAPGAPIKVPQSMAATSPVPTLQNLFASPASLTSPQPQATREQYKQLLEQKGYVIHSDSHSENDPTYNYFLVTNKYGDWAYVDVTNHSGIRNEYSNGVIMEANQVKISPTDESLMNCISPGVCGVAIEQGDQMNSYRRVNDKVIKSTFVRSHREGPQSGFILGSPVAYPIVTIGEIVLNTNRVNEEIRTSTYALERQALSQAKAKLNELDDEIVKLQKIIRNYKNGYILLLEQHTKEKESFINNIRTFEKEAREGKVHTEDEKRIMLSTIKHNVRLSKNFATTLNAGNQFKDLSKLINKASTEMLGIHIVEFLNAKSGSFSSRHKTLKIEAIDKYPFNYSKASTWGLPEALDRYTTEELIAGEINNIVPKNEEERKLVDLVRQVIQTYTIPTPNNIPSEAVPQNLLYSPVNSPVGSPIQSPIGSSYGSSVIGSTGSPVPVSPPAISLANSGR